MLRVFTFPIAALLLLASGAFASIAQNEGYGIGAANLLTLLGGQAIATDEKITTVTLGQSATRHGGLWAIQDENSILHQAGTVIGNGMIGVRQDATALAVQSQLNAGYSGPKAQGQVIEVDLAQNLSKVNGVGAATAGHDFYGDRLQALGSSSGALSENQFITISQDANVTGGDGPQDYTRIFYESYADPSVGWRAGAKRILVNFGDNVPHDCDLNEGVTSGTWSTGGDPGRDEVMGTGDDLDLQTVLADMAANGVVLLEAHTSSSSSAHWSYWTGITGGSVYITSSSTLVGDIATAVTVALTVPTVYGLHLEASSGFESWVSSVPDSYDELEPGDEVSFELTIQVPKGAEEGEYEFTVSAMDENGVSFGDQTVTITVEVSVPIRSFLITKAEITWAPNQGYGNDSFAISGDFQLPDEYQPPDLAPLALLSIQISGAEGKDEVALRNFGDAWSYDTPSFWGDSLGQGIDVTKMDISWTFPKSSFHINGELSLSGPGPGTLPREAMVTLEIPGAIAGSILGEGTVPFERSGNVWYYGAGPADLAPTGVGAADEWDLLLDDLFYLGLSAESEDPLPDEQPYSENPPVSEDPWPDNGTPDEVDLWFYELLEMFWLEP